MTGIGFGSTWANNGSDTGIVPDVGTSFSVTLDSTGKQTLDVTTLGLTTTTGKQVNGLVGQYDSDLFFTAGLYWEIVNSTTLRFWSTSGELHQDLILTGTIGNA